MILEGIAVALSTGILIAASVLPYIGLNRNADAPRAAQKSLNGLSLSNCFACGIFLGTCFIGLMPHVQMQEKSILEQLNVTDPHSQHPYPYLRSNVLVLAGFLLILFIEQVAFICLPSSHSHSPLETSARFQAESSASHEASEPLVNLDSDESDLDPLEEIQLRGFQPSNQSFHGHAEDGHAHHHHILPGDANSSMEYILLLVALSIHSVFEGIALGAQKDFVEFMKLLFSIMIHEVLCSFAYGVNLSKQRIPLKQAFGSILFLSCSLPLGILLMAVIGTFEALTALIFKFVLESLAAGIFIYVAAIEMLATEIPHHPEKAGFVKGVVVIAGAFIFYLINLVIA